MINMNKKEFFNHFPNSQEINLSPLYDKILLATKTQGEYYSNEFYPPHIWGSLHKLSQKLQISISSYGLFQLAEKRIIGFNSTEESTIPAKLIKIQNKSKFNKLEHKDYLGGVLSLGVKRSRFGDFIVKDQCCYMAVHEEVIDYIMSNLTKIGNCPCELTLLDGLEDIPNLSFDPITILLPSERIDSVVSDLCNVSRAKAQQLIKSNKVLINYIEIQENDYTINEDDVLTIRGVGKFKIGKTLGLSQKGKIRKEVLKFV